MNINTLRILGHVGKSNDIDGPSKVQLIFTNQAGIIGGSVSLLVFALIYTFFPFAPSVGSAVFTIISCTLFFSVLYLNRLSFTNFSGWLLVYAVPIFIMAVSLIHHTANLHFTFLEQEMAFYKIMLVSATGISLFVFKPENVLKIIAAAFPGMFFLVLFGPIHSIVLNGGAADWHRLDQFFTYASLLIVLVGVVAFALFERKRFNTVTGALQNELLKKESENLVLRQWVLDQQESIDSIKGQQSLFKEKYSEQAATIEKLGHDLMEKERLLAVANNEFLLADKKLQQVLYTVSHHLRAPAATIQGLLNLIDRRSLTPANSEIVSYLERTVGALHEVFREMTENLSAKERDIHAIEEVNLRQLFDRLHTAFYRDLNIYDIHFTYLIDGPVTIQSNSDKLFVILSHLLDNAIKFRAEGREAEIRISVKNDGHVCRFAVRDNGQGIDLEQYGNKIFYPYQKFHYLSSGKGLGLYLVKLHAESLGGNVTISSLPGKYTEVVVNINIAHSDTPVHKSSRQHALYHA